MTEAIRYSKVRGNGRAQRDHRDRRGRRRGKPGQPQLTPWAAGIFPGPQCTPPATFRDAGPGVSSGWPCPGPFLPALGLFPEAERGLGWGRNRPCQRPIPSFRPSPAQLPPFARRRFPCARTRFWHGKSGFEDTFHHSRKNPVAHFSHFFSSPFQRLVPPGPSSPGITPVSWYRAQTREPGRESRRILATRCHGHSESSFEEPLCPTNQEA